MMTSAVKGLDQAIKAMSQTADESVLPKVFPSQAFRLRWLVDLNGSWRGVESVLHVGFAGVRLTQVVLNAPGQNGKIGGVSNKEIGAWKHEGIIEWGASETHLLLACQSPELVKPKDYILETTQAQEIVALIKQHVVVATISELPDHEVKQRLTLMAQELDQMMTMKTEMAQVKKALSQLHADTEQARARNEQRQLQLETEQQRRREIATSLYQIAVRESEDRAQPLASGGNDLLQAFGVKPEDMMSPGRSRRDSVGSVNSVNSVNSVSTVASEIQRRLSICSLNSSIGSTASLNASIDAPSIAGTVDGSLEPPMVDEATQSVVIHNLLLTAQSLQEAGEASAAQHILKRVDTMMAQSAMSPPAVRRPSVSQAAGGATPERRRDSIVSLSVEAGEMTLEEGDRLISSGLNTTISGAASNTSLEVLTEDGVRDARAQKGAAARAHKKKTAAQVVTPAPDPHCTCALPDAHLQNAEGTVGAILPAAPTLRPVDRLSFHAAEYANGAVLTSVQCCMLRGVDGAAFWFAEDRIQHPAQARCFEAGRCHVKPALAARTLVDKL